eukprot:TRINITY_DN1280_c0_g2_i2.p1 TRINITY_DN1280_c0_g2~~TRINITY_DN1280_c0_g2_i2.p1  ORF type:complete len:141 (-),score=28.92 TRINITY_DN1280_c0_g2_i2:77-499(-)
MMVKQWYQRRVRGIICFPTSIPSKQTTFISSVYCLLFIFAVQYIQSLEINYNHIQARMSQPALVRSLYRQFLREGNKFSTYNFREYTKRRVRDGFRENAKETDPQKLEALIKRAKDDLDLVKRQVAVHALYANRKLVVEG